MKNVKLKLINHIYNSLLKKTKRSVSLFLFDKKMPVGIQLPVKHILIINWNGKIGDAIVSSFLFNELRKIKNIQISVITTSNLTKLYENTYSADNVYTVKSCSYLELFKVTKKMEDIDTIIPLMGYLNMKDLFFISRLNPNNLFSIDDELGRSNLQMGKRTNHLLMHDVFKFILKEIKIENINDNYIIPINSCKDTDTEFDIVFNPFGSRIDKSLSIEKSLKLLSEINKVYPNYKIGILNSLHTKDISDDISYKMRNNNITTIENIKSIYDAIDIINNASIVITVDTSIAHIASGLDKKLIAIYYKAGDSFNQWLIKEKLKTRIVLSDGIKNYKEKYMNNFNNNKIIGYIEELKGLE